MCKAVDELFAEIFADDIKAMKAEIADKDSMIASQNTLLADKDSQIARQSALIAQLQAQLEQYASQKS